MGLKKIPKKVWLGFSEDEKRYHELEYKKAFERNKRFTVISTRVIALICIFALFFIGFAMLQNAKEYGQIKDKYGPRAFCYMCGLESKKKCECEEYSSVYGYDKEHKLSENYSVELAEYNSRVCSGSRVVGTQGGHLDENEINFSFP